MTSLPKNKSKAKDKQIPHIDARSIDDIALEINRLKDQLKYNLTCLSLKKHELNENKLKDDFKKIMEKPRKTFSFYVNSDKITPDIQILIQNTLSNYLEKMKARMTKSFFLNNFIYFKTNINITIQVDTIDMPNGMVMTQINPKNILKLQ
jgi:hypothetical protein